MRLDFQLNELSMVGLGFNVNPEYIIGVPNVKTSYIDVPYANGSIDMTEVLIDGAVYENRQIAFTLEKLRPKHLWDDAYATLLGLFHGQKVKVRTPYDHDYYFVGRVSIGDNTRGSMLTIPVTIQCEPYRYKNAMTVIEKRMAGSMNVILENAMMPTNVSLECDKPISVVLPTGQISLSEGRHTLPIQLLAGKTTLGLIATTSTHIKIMYQEGVM